jgi:hypothetical protein
VLGGGPHVIPGAPASAAPAAALTGRGAARGGADLDREADGRRRVRALGLDRLRRLAATRELGAGDPGPVAVDRFDDHPVSRLLDPPLTAIGWDTRAAAVAAAEMIAAAVAGDKPAAEVVINPVLAVRSSTRRELQHTLPNFPGAARWSNAAAASPAGNTRSIGGATRPSASSGTTPRANACTAAPFSSIGRARSTVPISDARLPISGRSDMSNSAPRPVPDDDDQASGRQRPQVAGQVRARPASTTPRLPRRPRPPAPRVGAHRRQPLAGGLVARVGQHPGAGRQAELDGGRADAPAGTVDQRRRRRPARHG